MGPIRITFTQYNGFGVMDHWVDLGNGRIVYVPLRIIPNEDGSEVVLTLFRQSGMSTDKFAEDEAGSGAILRLSRRSRKEYSLLDCRRRALLQRVSGLGRYHRARSVNLFRSLRSNGHYSRHSCHSAAAARGIPAGGIRPALLA